MTDQDRVQILRTALEGVMPILTGHEPAPADIREWARLVVDAEMALIRTRPYVGVADDLADILLGAP